MSSKLKKAIGAVKDQTSISLAKVNNSSNLEVVVLKATTHDDVPIDDKYVYEVLQLVSSNKTHAAACARAIGKRIGRTRNWVVALKSLMLVLRIFQDGDPYFPREVLHAMKRGAKILNLSGFRDDSNSSPWDFTAFVRTFALYLDERLECFLTGKLQRRYKYEGSTSGYQRTKSRSGRRANEPVRDMKPAMLLDKMSYWQRLLDRAIATRPTGVAKTNRLVQISLYAIVQESFELYKDISDGLTLVLDSFFHLQYQNCVSAFQTCVKAVKQFEELGAFYTLCKGLGVGRTSEYPSVQTISEELIETLQEFLKDQSSFPSSAKPTNRLLLLPAPQPPDSPSYAGSRSNRHDSLSGRSDISATTDDFSERTNSEFGSQSTSLEDLISATESWKCPSISIDLETYSASQQENSFEIADTGSSRSLPVSNSMADLMSLEEWTEQEDNDDKDQQQQNQNGLLDSSVSKNWELMLAETLSLSAPAQPPSDNNTNTFNAFPEQAISPSALPQPALANIKTNTFNPFPQQPITSSTQPQPVLSNNNTNTFNAFPQPPIPSSTQPQPVLSDNNTNTFSAFPEQTPPPNTSNNSWELVLFDATAAPQQPTPNTLPPLDNNKNYNPFLQDEIELPAAQSAVQVPTFLAAPTFSAHNPNQNDSDPFADTFSSGQQMFSSGSTDQRDLFQEQQLWLQNQNKIITKRMA